MDMTLSEYEHQQVQGDLLNERIEAEKQDLLTRHYKPTLPDNIHEALCNLSTEQFEYMGKHIEQGDYHGLGLMMATWNRDYNEAIAKDVATGNILNLWGEDHE